MHQPHNIGITNFDLQAFVVEISTLNHPSRLSQIENEHLLTFLKLLQFPSAGEGI
jgi:hypothetical protein